MESGLRDNLILSRLEDIQLASNGDEFQERLLLLLSEVETRPLSAMEKDLLDDLLGVHAARLDDGDMLLSALKDRLGFGFWPQISQLQLSSMMAQADDTIDDKQYESTTLRESSGRPSSSDDGSASLAVPSTLTTEALLPFVLRGPQENARFKCVVRRSRSGIRMVFRMYLQEHCTTDDMALSNSQMPKETMLIAAKRAKSAKSPNIYSFWCSPQAKLWQDHNSAAQLRIVSPGLYIAAAPAAAAQHNAEHSNGPVLVHIAEGSDKVLLVTALIAQRSNISEAMLTDSWEMLQAHNADKNRALLQLPSGVTVLSTRSPHRDSTYGVYTMRFGGEGRVKASSRKNIVMDRFTTASSSQEFTWSTDRAYSVLQLGKMDDDTFSLDFGFPVCPFQAFAIAVAAFNS